MHKTVFCVFCIVAAAATQFAEKGVLGGSAGLQPREKRRDWMGFSPGIFGSPTFSAGSIAALGQAQQYKLGRPATPEEIRALDISVAPDGSGLPKGSGTVAQGQRIYKKLCANCHGDRGQGMLEYPALAGGQGTLKSKEPLLTVGSYWPYATTVWDFIHRTMPYARPGTLTPDQTYAVTAFVLYLNGILHKDAELNETTLPRVEMPNRNGFVPDPRPDVHNNPGNAFSTDGVSAKPTQRPI